MRGNRTKLGPPGRGLRTSARFGIAALALLTGAGIAGAQPVAAQQHETTVLVFSKTAGFRHDSIPAGIAAIQELGEQNGFHVEATEDAAAFTPDNLSRFAAVVWLSTTGDVLNDEQQQAFEGYIAAGGGYAGVHAASDTEYDWPWYGDLVGAWFKSHPQIQQANVAVENHDHPSTGHLPDTWTRTDEWYNYQENPRANVQVLATLDEGSYDPGPDAMGDHPIAWCHTLGSARSWYTGGGHTIESYAEPEFRTHLLGGIQYAAGLAEADCAPDGGGDPAEPPGDDQFDQITLAKSEPKTGEPIALAVLPDRRVIHTSRDGRVWLTTPEASTTLAAQIPVYNHDEDGLQGVAIDPDFANNKWVYFYYAPPLSTPPGDAPETGTPEQFEPFKGYNQLSRFKFTDDGNGAGTIDLASEQQIMQVNTERGICCHAGGEIDFDAAGNLLLSTGDDTNPFASDGFTPIDERADRNPVFDGQRSAGNTNDLRGKLLRITVAADGTYTVPEGNLFAPGTEKTRPEIYAMGFRNPFRFSVDKETGWIHLGDYGPDAGAADPNRGPGGTVEFNLIKEPGNFGWPYCVGDNTPYIDYDFASGQSGAAFDCAAPKNESPHNTGLVDLPPVQPAWIPYDGGSVPEFGTGSESPMGGPVYHFDPDLDSPTKFPEYYDGKNFAYEWGRGWIKTIDVGPDGERGEINPFFDSMELSWPMNIEFGPEGSLYVLDYGDEWFGGSDASAVYRIDYTKGNRTPQVQLTADKTSGPAPLTVQFDPAGTSDPDGGDLTYAWDFQGDGTVDSTEEGPVSYTYDEPGQYSASLSVTDETGLTGVRSLVITSGNTAPTVELNLPANGGFFGFGDSVPFEVTVTDPEDPSIDCSKVIVEYILGHDAHGHPLSRTTGCEGEIVTPADEGHGLDANVFGIINARYTDNGVGDVPPLTSDDEAVLQPKLKQAEFWTENNGTQIVAHGEASGGQRVGHIENGDWIKFDPVNLTGVDAIGYRVTSGGGGGTITVHKDAVDGPVVQTVQVTNTGGWDTYADIPPAPITDPGGSGPLYLVFSGGEGGLMDVDTINVVGDGVAAPGTEECTPIAPDQGYRSLFDGTEASLDGWVQAGPGSFEHQEDCTIKSVGGMGLLSFDEEFNAYSLTMDWKMAGDDNSGIFVGYPDPGDDPWVAVNQGYEIQIDATDAPERTTGSIYSFQSADIAARDEALNPPGEWNSYEIIVEGQTIQVYLNGVLINDFTSTDPARDLMQGYVGIQNHGNGDDVWFRDIQIKELADEVAPTTTATFEPAGPDGWHPGTVPVQLSATDDSGRPVAKIEYKLDDGPWTRYTETVEVTGDGDHTLLYRATDRAGNVEADKAATIKIDGTKPTLMVAGVAEGRVYGDATDVILSWHAADATSGVESVTGQLDGEPVSSGRVVSLYQLPLGFHGFSVSATDVAGNVQTQTVNFATTTSLRDMSQLLDRFRATNRLTLSQYRQLDSLMDKIRRAEANGNDRKAVRFLGTFRLLVTDETFLSDADIRTVLERDANAVIDSIEGVAVLPVAVNSR